jgi:hypothetical protein
VIKLLKKGLPLLGIILLFRLLSKIDLVDFLDRISQVPLDKILVLISCCWFGLIVKGLRWLIITRFIKVSKLDLLRVFYASMFLGVITPGRIGELSKIKFLKERGLDYLEALYITIYDRIFDVGYLLITSLFFLSYVYEFSSTLVLSIVLFTILFLFVQYFVAKKLIVHEMNILTMFICYGITIVSYLVFGLGFAFLLDLSELNHVVLSTLSITLGNLVALVPISIMGLGTREYVLMNVLPFIPSVQLISSSLIHLTTSVLASLLFCSFFYSKSLFKAPEGTNKKNI